MNKLLNFEACGGVYAKCLQATRGGISSSAFGMGKVERALFSAQIKPNTLLVMADYVSAKQTVQDLQTVGYQAYFLPPAVDTLTYKRLQSNEDNAMRTETLVRMAQNKTEVVVTCAEALFCKVPVIKRLLENVVRIEVGQELSLDALQQTLLRQGYHREGLVSAMGQYALRGDILDIALVSSSLQAYRIELFGDTVESIHALELETQTSVGEALQSIEILPSTSVVYTPEEVALLQTKLQEVACRTYQDTQTEQTMHRMVEDVLKDIESQQYTYALDYLAPFLPQAYTSIFEVFGNLVVVVDDAKMVYTAMQTKQKEIENRFQALQKSGAYLVNNNSGYENITNILAQMQQHTLLVHQNISQANPFCSPQQVFTFSHTPMVRYTHNFSLLVQDVQNWLQLGWRVKIYAKDLSNAQRLQKDFEEYSIFLDVKHSSLAEPESAFIPQVLPKGFALPDVQCVVIGTYDIFKKKVESKHLKAGRKDVFNIPKIGDYVVHEVHGVGVCEGTITLTGSFGTKDFIVVRYRDNDKLYVPIDQMNLLDRFSGAETPKRLSKIGGVEFAHVKERVRASIKKMAIDLLRLYAERERKIGFAFCKDDCMQKEFEDAFMYTETEDQLLSIAEIKKDMESTKVMDRLLCGDVGFGKTEVALRAAFKAVLSGKQVAFLAPTTILSEQHYQTCKARMENFGVRIACLNRFKQAHIQKKAIEDIALGKIDIVIGTHRILSNDVVFQDLGLIILDEEQKFGVEDKEKLKVKYPNVDVLTLSATPIPRTLHMSLSGMRDCSVIRTAPTNRLPVQTFVTEYTEDLVRDAILREMSRGGQVFVLYNRVEHMYTFKETLQRIVPSARIVVGHGKLKGKELEDVMYQFMKGEADILLCTTIIENGVNFPNANTLIVIDSERFGISQLYQIKGRVGRSDKVGFAYFTYNEQKVLTEEATKRLSAISEFTELGSGFKLAMRDLEIRGSGSVLGAEQHGHMEKVGYELYTRMLAQEMRILQGAQEQTVEDTEMKVALDAFIAETYITDAENRMTAYKNISRIATRKELTDTMQELEDMFGKVPIQTQNLMHIALVKNMANKLGVVQIVCKPTTASIVFASKEQVLENEYIAEAVYAYRQYCALDFTQKASILFKNLSANVAEVLQMLEDFFAIIYRKQQEKNKK